jgi:hypothetical protein
MLHKARAMSWEKGGIRWHRQCVDALPDSNICDNIATILLRFILITSILSPDSADEACI